MIDPWSGQWISERELSAIRNERAEQEAEYARDFAEADDFDYDRAADEYERQFGW